MIRKIPHAIAALAAAGAVTLASAAPTPVAPTPSYVNEPIAASTVANPADPLVGQMVQALNADNSLQGSKLTVSIDESGNVLLTGAAISPMQMQRASQIVAGIGGDKKVINAIQPDQVAYVVNGG